MSATQKLIVKGIERDVAELLTAAGITTPRAIRLASQTRIKEITGLTTTEARKLKEKFERKSAE